MPQYLRRLRGPAVLSAALWLGCSSGSAPKPEPLRSTGSGGAPMRLMLGPSWFKFRGRALGLSAQEAKRRDLNFDEDHAPPANFWDPTMAKHTASVWRLLCNECHGGKRSIERAASIPPPPNEWPSKPAMFFVQERPHREIYLKILNGGHPDDAGPEGPMPPFDGKLSREQIWGMIYFVENASQKGDVRVQ